MRTALENASSIASLLLTTEAMVAELPEPKESSAMPPMPPGGKWAEWAEWEEWIFKIPFYKNC